MTKVTNLLRMVLRIRRKREISIYSPLLGNIWRVLESYDIDPRQAVDEALYQPGQANLMSRRISFEQYDSTVSRAVSLIDDPAVAIRVAELFHPSNLGAFGHAWMASSSLRMALLCAERFDRMFNEDVDLHVLETSGYVRLTYELKRSTVNAELLGETHIAVFLALCRLNFGKNLQPLEVVLTRPTPTATAPWYDFFGPGLQFEGNSHCLTLSNQDADTILTCSDSELVAIHINIMRRHLSDLDRNNVLDRSRLCILDLLPLGYVTEKDVAESLNMSKRTMRRKLKENGATFGAVLRQTRKELAERYIQNRQYNMTEIAFLLGFSDTSSFSRAFRSWFGCSPTQARQSGQALEHP